jgi:hypothetical protein
MKQRSDRNKTDKGNKGNEVYLARERKGTVLLEERKEG